MNKLNLSRYTPFFRKYAPPGYEVEREVRVFKIGLLLAIGFSLLFLVRYLHTYHYEKHFSFWILDKDAIMPDFSELISGWLYGFFLLPMVMLAYVPVHYMQYHQESKCIYLMRRLPNPFELHYRCWVIPVACGVVCLLIAFVCLLIYFAVYMLVTPDQCLTPDQWQKIWSVIS